MTITHKKGNVVDALLNGEVDFLLHGCNAQGVMGSGVAKEIKERVPSAYELYRDIYECCGEFNLGEAYPDWESGVVHLITQRYYGTGKRHLNYGALCKSFADFIDELMDSNVEKEFDELVVGIPYLIGCGLAGGDEKIVLELIEHCLAPYLKEVILYSL